MSSKRLAKERETATRRKPDITAETMEQLSALLDQELKSLPDKYRAPIVLCDLEGRSIKEAAQQLGCPLGTISTRLARGRRLLTRRLLRHGLTLTSGAIAMALAQDLAVAGVPPQLMRSTVKAAELIAAGNAAAIAAISTKVAALTEGALAAMSLNKLKVVAVVLLFASLTGLPQFLLSPQTLQTAQADKQNQAPFSQVQDRSRNVDKTNQEERDRRTDVKGRILFACCPHQILAARGVASIHMNEQKENLLIKALDPLKGFEDRLRISPDGKQLAYVYIKFEDRSLRFTIHVRSIDAAAEPTDMEVDGQQVCWSPDGAQIAVSHGKSGNVIVDVKTKQQTEIKLPPDHWIMDWSPNGKWFLVHSEAEKGKWRLAQPTKGETEVRYLPGTEGIIGGGRICPDGKSVLFDRRAEKKISNLWILNIQDGKTRRVTQDLNGMIRGYSWSPSGRRIAYTWVRFDADSATDPSEQETESFLTVNDLEGKNPVVLLSEKTKGTSAVHFTCWDWR
jgi:hypothetical protein